MHRTKERGARGAIASVVALCSAMAVANVSASAAPIPTTSTSTGTGVLRAYNLAAQQHTIPLRPTAHGQARGIAMVQGAVYDAVNAIDRGHQSYLVDAQALDIDPAASVDAAIATAAHHVLVAIVPSVQVAGLDTTYAQTLDLIPDGDSEDEGIRAGAAAATAMLTARADDGFMGPFTAVIGTDPGEWRPTAPTGTDPDGWVGSLRPFLMESPDQFRSSGPNALTSEKYAKEYNEVKELGSFSSTRRTADQTTAAIFWQFAPTAFWNGMARELMTEHGLDAAEGARLLAMINLAAADGAIACWNDKNYWNFWRPITAIREGDSDGNPATVGDPTWRSLFDPATPTVPTLATPPFPDHPSGHGCVSAAALGATASFFGTDKVPITMRSGRFPNDPRSFDRLSQALAEIIDARVWGGIHFRTADVAGSVIGKKVVGWMDRNYFQPTSWSTSPPGGIRHRLYAAGRLSALSSLPAGEPTSGWRPAPRHTPHVVAEGWREEVHHA